MSITCLFWEFQADPEKQYKVKVNTFNVPLKIHQKFSLRQDESSLSWLLKSHFNTQYVKKPDLNIPNYDAVSHENSLWAVW